MILENYYKIENNKLRVSRQQASDFAKRIANDFNPLHDTDSKRFCVPGDLLFGLVLDQYGLSQNMRFVFSGMVGDGIELQFPGNATDKFSLSGSNGKDYLHVERSGDTTHDKTFIHRLVEAYVAFSGHAFPYVLVPLMEAHSVMVNPDRPLIIYESMEIHLHRLDIANPELKLSGTCFNIDRKRGEVQLAFTLLDNGEVTGKGTKNMVLSGLRPYDAERMQRVVDDYLQRQEQFKSASNATPA
ncbi:DUF3581 domain-containing protein [Thiolapillus sp.]